MAETRFEALSQDLQMEILTRLPLESLGKCICASKKLATIIRTKYFRNLYLLRSMTKPLMLFLVRNPKLNPTEEDLLFYSVYQEEEPLLSCGQQDSHIFQGPLGRKVSQPIRGLICIRDKTKIKICNPTTKKCRTLLEVKTCKEPLIADYFGCDQTKDEFKVLCLTPMKSEGAEKHLVLTMIPGQESRKWITCEHHHTPVTYQGLCKGGVLYYGARSNTNKSLVMSFNVKSEEFNIIALPEEVNISSHWKLVNYNREIALVNEDDRELRENGVLQIWIRKQIEKRWEKTLIEILGWKETVGSKTISFKGTNGTGELVFALNYLDTGPLLLPLKKTGSVMVLCYDTVTEKLRRFKIEREFKGLLVETFLDHVDSPQLM